MGSFLHQFPQIADFIHVWALSIANFFREFGINFPPPHWGLNM
ncbi:hypothetical protein [Corynebacterium hindlerae]|nr:hypothetical protein [Corynebacterium hindlerae]